MTDNGPKPVLIHSLSPPLGKPLQGGLQVTEPSTMPSSGVQLTLNLDECVSTTSAQGAENPSLLSG